MIYHWPLSLSHKKLWMICCLDVVVVFRERETYFSSFVDRVHPLSALPQAIGFPHLNEKKKKNIFVIVLFSIKFNTLSIRYFLYDYFIWLNWFIFSWSFLCQFSLSARFVFVFSFWPLVICGSFSLVHFGSCRLQTFRIFFERDPQLVCGWSR